MDHEKKTYSLPQFVFFSLFNTKTYQYLENFRYNVYNVNKKQFNYGNS